MQFSFLFDANRCTSCYTCEIACKQENALAPAADTKPGSTGPRWRRVVSLEEGAYPNTRVSYVSFSWENCKPCFGRSLAKDEPPACVAACPGRAIQFGQAELFDQKIQERNAIKVMEATNPELFIIAAN
ncbi:MAG: hypothetical protein P8Y38_07985 [Deltaproteobacteria bacterium]|jgi:Fe-S-cluster-containing dehydrogenase component